MTPERFHGLLSEHYPPHAQPFAVITAGYIHARYAAAPVAGREPPPSPKPGGISHHR